VPFLYIPANYDSSLFLFYYWYIWLKPPYLRYVTGDACHSALQTVTPSCSDDDTTCIGGGVVMLRVTCAIYYAGDFVPVWYMMSMPNVLFFIIHLLFWWCLHSVTDIVWCVFYYGTVWSSIHLISMTVTDTGVNFTILCYTCYTFCYYYYSHSLPVYRYTTVIGIHGRDIHLLIHTMTFLLMPILMTCSDYCYWWRYPSLHST